jgi:hypothetical protein
MINRNKKVKLSTSAYFLATLFYVLFFSSCDNAGITQEILNSNEQDLPPELKGLKVYCIPVGSGSFVKVAVLDNKVNSTTYQVGKLQESLILVDNSIGKQIKVSQILLENDSIIVCRK